MQFPQHVIRLSFNVSASCGFSNKLSLENVQIKHTLIAPKIRNCKNTYALHYLQSLL